jgi:hypothetical protein
MRLRDIVAIAALLSLAAPSMGAEAATRATSTGEWPQLGGNARHTGAAEESIFTTSDIASLEIRWSRNPGGSSFPLAMLPALADGKVWVTTTLTEPKLRDVLFVLDGTTGHTLWRGTGLPNGEAGQPVVAGDRVFASEVDTANGYAHLAMFPAGGCESSRCRPAWTGTWYEGYDELSSISGNAQITVAGGRIYIVGHYHLEVFDAHGCGARACEPLWTAPLTQGSGAAAVAGGRVFVDPGYGAGIAVFDADGCAAATCSPLWTGESGAGTPMVSHGTVYTAQSATLAAYPVEGCPISPCDPAWTAPTDVNGAWTAMSNSRVFLSNDRLSVYPAFGCPSPPCSTLWRSDYMGGTGVSVTNDLVLVDVADVASFNQTMAAFDAAGCGAPICDPVATITVPVSGYGGQPQPVIGENVIVLGGYGVTALGLRG